MSWIKNNWVMLAMLLGILAFVVWKVIPWNYL